MNTHTYFIHKVNFEEYQKSQSEELVALSETIKMLNDDDALDLFKKTLPSSSAAAASSFLQIQVQGSTQLSPLSRPLSLSLLLSLSLCRSLPLSLSPSLRQDKPR